MLSALLVARALVVHLLRLTVQRQWVLTVPLAHLHHQVHRRVPTGTIAMAERIPQRPARAQLVPLVLPPRHLRQTVQPVQLIPFALVHLMQPLLVQYAQRIPLTMKRRLVLLPTTRCARVPQQL